MAEINHPDLPEKRLNPGQGAFDWPAFWDRLARTIHRQGASVGELVLILPPYMLPRVPEDFVPIEIKLDKAHPHGRGSIMLKSDYERRE